jgi:hypothetical protein
VPGKIAVTTSSDQARAAFRKGRDLYEKLRPEEARHRFDEALAKASAGEHLWIRGEEAGSVSQSSERGDLCAKLVAAYPGEDQKSDPFSSAGGVFAARIQAFSRGHTPG